MLIWIQGKSRKDDIINVTWKCTHKAYKYFPDEEMIVMFGGDMRSLKQNMS